MTPAATRAIDAACFILDRLGEDKLAEAFADGLAADPQAGAHRLTADGPPGTFAAEPWDSWAGPRRVGVPLRELLATLALPACAHPPGVTEEIFDSAGQVVAFRCWNCGDWT